MHGNRKHIESEEIDWRSRNSHFYDFGLFKRSKSSFPHPQNENMPGKYEKT